MRTLGTPKGAVRQAALGGIAASLMIGLAACGNTVAGPGAAGPGAAGPGSAAGAARATAGPSPAAVNPGGVRIPANATAPAAICREIPGLTRMTVTVSTQPSSLNAREVLPRGFTIRDPAAVRQARAAATVGLGGARRLARPRPDRPGTGAASGRAGE